MPYEHPLSDEERKQAAGFAKFWRGVSWVLKGAGHASGNHLLGQAASAGPSAIARAQERKADTDYETRSTPSEQERIDRFYDAHPSAW